MRISDWSSDVVLFRSRAPAAAARSTSTAMDSWPEGRAMPVGRGYAPDARAPSVGRGYAPDARALSADRGYAPDPRNIKPRRGCNPGRRPRSEEHTSELQSLMRISYAVFCLKKKKQQ